MKGRIQSQKTFLANLCSITMLKKKITKTVFTLTLLLTVLLLPAQTGQAASGGYKTYNFVAAGSASELSTKNYSVFQTLDGFRLVKSGKTIKTVKGVRGTVLYGDKDFYYTAYAGKNGNYTCTVYCMTAAGKAAKIGTVSKVPYLFDLDAVYKNKVYGHYSRSSADYSRTTTTLYSIDVKTHKTVKVCSLDGEIGYVRGEETSPVISSGKLLFVTGDHAEIIDLTTGKKKTAAKNLKASMGDVNTSVWKDKTTAYVEQENAIQKYNKKTEKFEKDTSLSKYAQKYDIVYADKNVILYAGQNTKDHNEYYYLYMRGTKKKTKIGKGMSEGGIVYIDGPVTKGDSVYFITVKRSGRNVSSDIWKASIKTGKAQKVKSYAQELSFRSDNKKIGYMVNDSKLTIKYVYTL